MKSRLTLTIEKNTLANAKVYAHSNGMSVSELVEKYFINLVKPKVDNIVGIIDQLDKPRMNISMDLVKEYYESKLNAK